MSAVLDSKPVTPTIDSEIAAYDSLKGELEAQFMDKWVVIKGGRLEGVFDEFEEAAGQAVKRFGRGPYLIRRVGEKPEPLPASVVFSAHRHGR